MRTATLITYNPVTEAYEMSLSTLTTTHFTSYDITCTDELHVGRNLWVGDQFLSAEAIRNLKTTPDTLSLNSLFANEITITARSGDSRGMLSVQDIYTDNVYGEQIMFNTADIGVITCSLVKLGNSTLDEALLSQLINGSGSSSGGGSVSNETVSAAYAYITNFVSARTFRLNGVDSDSGSLQLGTRDFMYVQYDSEEQVLNTYARGVFHADDASVDRLGVRVLTVDNITFTSTPDVDEMNIASLNSETGSFTSLNSETGSFTSVSADEGTFDMLKLLETSFDGEFFKIGDDVVFRIYQNAYNQPIFEVPCTMFADTLRVYNTFSTADVECSSVTATNSVSTDSVSAHTIKLGNATEMQNNTALTLDRNYFDTLQASVSINRTDISNLSLNVNSNNADISNLQTNVSNLQTNVSNFHNGFQANLLTLSDEVVKLKSATADLSGLRVIPRIDSHLGTSVYSLELVANDPEHSYICLTPENFDTKISLGDKIVDLYANFGVGETYPVGTIGLFVAYNYDTYSHPMGTITRDDSGTGISLYRLTMPFSTDSGVSIDYDRDNHVPGRWKLLNDCPPGTSVVLVIRIS